MRSASTKFVLTVGLLAALFSGALVYYNWSTTREQLAESAGRETELALQFDLAIREYVRETIRPHVEERGEEDEFIPEVMSTSFVARSIFDKVRRNLPDYVIKFSSDSPRNPANAAGPDELAVLRYFREHPEAARWTGQLRMNGESYRAVCTPRRFEQRCLACHGRPEDAPASLVAKYGPEAGFHRAPGDVLGVDTVAVPTKSLDAALARQARGELWVLAVWLTLLFAGVLLAYRWIVGRRLEAVTRYFRLAVRQAETGRIAPIRIRGRDEIGVLAASFNALADRLNALYETLDARVRRRTADLEAENAQRRLAEQRLDESRQFLQTVIDAIPQSTVVIDADDRVVLANRAAAGEYQAGTLLLGTACHELHCGSAGPCRPDPGRCPLEEVRARKAPVTLTLAGEGPNGRILEVSAAPIFDEADEVVQVVMSFRDVTHRKQAEEALKESEELFRTMTSAAQDGIVLLDQDGNVSFWNRAAEKIFGYAQEEILGQNLHRVLARSADWEKHSRAFPDLQRTGRGAAVGQTVELVGVRKDGSEVAVELSLSSMLRKGEWHAVGVLRDLSERRRTEAALAQKEEQLRQSQKLEAVGSLAGGIAHEFNNLLQAIRGYTAFAMQELESSDQPYQDLNEVLAATERAADLTRQLLSFSRRDSLRLESMHVNEVVARLAKMIRPLIGEDVELSVLLDENAGRIGGDATMLQQVLMNLCINARDAMPGGGRLTIRTQCTCVSGEYAELHPGLQAGDYVCILVTDTGCGMPPEVVNRIFEPFFTTKEVGKGTGLGLAMAFGVVQQHHGAIHVYSEPGTGTTFRVYLPLQKGQAMREDPRSTNRPRGGDETILIAEDEPIVRDVVARILRQAGYTVFLARDGLEAVELLSLHAEDVSLALLDVVMPRMSGRDACRQLKRIKPDVAVVFCTGYDPAANQVEFIASEGLYLVEKPFDSDALLRIVREALDAQRGPGMVISAAAPKACDPAVCVE